MTALVEVSPPRRPDETAPHRAAGGVTTGRAAALGAGLAVLCGAVVPLGGPALLAPLAVVAALLGVAVHARRPRTLPLLALAAAATPPLLVLPLSVAVGGKSLYLSDLLLPLAAAVALLRPSRTPRADLVVWAYTAVVVLQAAVGVVRRQPFDAFSQDLRGPVYLVCGFLVASRLWTAAAGRPTARSALAVLWYSAGAMVVTIATGIELLAGRSEEVRAHQVGGAAAVVDATRFIVNSKGLAFIALVVCLVVLVAADATARQRRTAALLVVPAALVTFLSYARATLLALGLCVLVAALLHRRLGLSRQRVAASALAVAAAVGAVGVTGSAGALSDPEGGVVARQVAGFETRVLGGLTAESAESPGNVYRLRENRYALEAAARNPLFGHGIGAAFKPVDFGEAALSAFTRDPDFGRRFIHNGWLWYLVKTGLVGLVAFSLLVMAPVVAALRAPRVPRRHLDPVTAGLALSVLGLLLINVFEPDLHRVGTAPVAGAVLGFLALQASRARHARPPAPPRSRPHHVRGGLHP